MTLDEIKDAVLEVDEDWGFNFTLLSIDSSFKRGDIGAWIHTDNSEGCLRIGHIEHMRVDEFKYKVLMSAKAHEWI